MADRLKLAIGLIEEVAEQMNTAGKVCECCGITRRENMDDYQGRQALDAASQRLIKLYEKLYEGTWEGREIAPVVGASTLRGGK